LLKTSRTLADVLGQLDIRLFNSIPRRLGVRARVGEFPRRELPASQTKRWCDQSVAELAGTDWKPFVCC